MHRNAVNEKERGIYYYLHSLTLACRLLSCQKNEDDVLSIFFEEPISSQLFNNISMTKQAIFDAAEKYASKKTWLVCELMASYGKYQIINDRHPYDLSSLAEKYKTRESNLLSEKNSLAVKNGRYVHQDEKLAALEGVIESHIPAAENKLMPHIYIVEQIMKVRELYVYETSQGREQHIAKSRIKKHVAGYLQKIGRDDLVYGPTGHA